MVPDGVDVALSIGDQPRRTVLGAELCLFLNRPEIQELASRVKALDPQCFQIRYKNVAFAIHRHMPRILEEARPRPFRAKLGHLLRESKRGQPRYQARQLSERREGQ